MLHGFFLHTGKTFRLGTHTKYHLPELCTRASSVYPYLIPERTCVFPGYTFLPASSCHIPLFVPIVVDKETRVVDPSTSSECFYLVFYPNTSSPPDERGITKEYWSCIEPMLICRDTCGYYLGVASDPNIILFEKTTAACAECWISRVESGYSEALCYTTGPATFSTQPIYLSRKSTPA